MSRLCYWNEKSTDWFTNTGPLYETPGLWFTLGINSDLSSPLNCRESPAAQDILYDLMQLKLAIDLLRLRLPRLRHRSRKLLVSTFVRHWCWHFHVFARTIPRPPSPSSLVQGGEESTVKVIQYVAVELFLWSYFTVALDTVRFPFLEVKLNILHF